VAIDQLWFGWAARGAEGVNKQQIIAGSGVLTDSRNPRTIQVLASCYAPPQLAFGWMDHPGLRVAFRRRIAGRDGRGRLGRFFVHALAADPIEMPPPVLAQLWSAGIWADDAPAEPDSQLDAFDAPDDLMLGAAPAAVEEEHLRVLLAAHLWNLARGGRSALDVDGATAVAIATAFGQVLPSGLALRGFSTEESERHAQKYDLVAGLPPTGQFASIAPDSSVSGASRSAASLLLDAAHGDDVAKGAVEALAERAATRDAFAAVLHTWAEVDRRPSSHGERFPQELASMFEQVAGSTDLVLRLADGDGAERIAEAFVARLPAARAVIGTAASNGRGAALVAVLQPSLVALTPSQALALLEELADVAPQVYGQLLAELAGMWTSDGSSATLEPAEVLSLVRNLLSTGGPMRTVELLASIPASAGWIASAGDIPARYRALAVAANAGALPAPALAGELANKPGFAEVLLDVARPEILDAVAAAVDAVPPRDALEIVRACERFASQLDVDAWRWSAYRRSPLLERLNGVSLLIRHRDSVSAVWMERLLDTYVETVKQELDAGTSLRVLEVALMHETSVRSSAWNRALSALQRDDLTALGMARVVSETAQHLSWEDWEVISEFAVERSLVKCASERDFEQAVRELRVGEPREVIALCLARAARRWHAHPRVAAATVIWIARRVNQELLPTSVLNEEPVSSLRVLDDRWQTYILGMGFDTPKELRRWLRLVLNVQSRFKSRIPRRSRA